MGLLSSFDTNRDELNTGSGTGKLIVDLSTFKVGGTPLGKTPWDGDFFAQSLLKNETFEPKESGYELGSAAGLLNFAFITLAQFQGVFLISDHVTTLSQKTTKEEILNLFGNPFWTDLDNGEAILFYEYRAGEIELQFEFPDDQNLGFITLMKDGILSVADQRKSYGVTKSWPPEK